MRPVCSGPRSLLFRDYHHARRIPVASQPALECVYEVPKATGCGGAPGRKDVPYITGLGQLPAGQDGHRHARPRTVNPTFLLGPNPTFQFCSYTSTSHKIHYVNFPSRRSYGPVAARACIHPRARCHATTTVAQMDRSCVPVPKCSLSIPPATVLALSTTARRLGGSPAMQVFYGSASRLSAPLGARWPRASSRPCCRTGCTIHCFCH
jgi:hypothetical protein